jgi:four helix bundle protein
MADSILRDKSKEFAKQIVLLCKTIKQEHRESVLTNQLLRSGTSIGANIHEAQYAQGKKGFISKFEISLKEVYETEYWLELLHRTNYIDGAEHKALNEMCTAIRVMPVASCRTMKSNAKEDNKDA